MIVWGDLILKRNPEVFFLGSEYLQATKGSGGNITKKSGNVKKLYCQTNEKTPHSNGFRQEAIYHWLWALGELLYFTVLLVLFYKITNTEKIAHIYLP